MDFIAVYHSEYMDKLVTYYPFTRQQYEEFPESIRLMLHTLSNDSNQIAFISLAEIEGEAILAWWDTEINEIRTKYLTAEEIKSLDSSLMLMLIQLEHNSQILYLEVEELKERQPTQMVDDTPKEARDNGIHV